MERIIIKDMSDIATLMYDAVKNSQSACFVGFKDDACELIKNLLLIYDDTFVDFMDIEPEDLGGYKKEYVVILDCDMGVWCERAYDETEKCYNWFFEDIAYIADDCNSAVLNSVSATNSYEVGYDLDDDECDGNCECCCAHDNNHEEVTRVATDENGNIRGFEKSWSTHEDGLHYNSYYSYYSNNQDMLKHMLDNFNIKY